MVMCECEKVESRGPVLSIYQVVPARKYIYPHLPIYGWYLSTTIIYQPGSIEPRREAGPAGHVGEAYLLGT